MVERRELRVSKRNVVWLVVIAIVAGIVGARFGFWWGLLAAVVVLVISEGVERMRRRSPSG